MNLFKKNIYKILVLIISFFILAVPAVGCATFENKEAVYETTNENKNTPDVYEDISYTGMSEVAEYIHRYGHLPNNYITKSEAKALGWDASSGNLSEVAPGKSIGGDRFGNYESKLPKSGSRKYYECDIDYTGGKRNAKRLVYSNDGYIYYTEDHYSTFKQIY